MEILATFFQGIDTVSIISLIIAGIITMLMAVIGHFLKQVNRQLEDLSKAIVNLQITLSTEQTNIIHLKAQCDNHSRKVDEKIDEFNRSIDDHELRITMIEKDVSRMEKEK